MALASFSLLRTSSCTYQGLSEQRMVPSFQSSAPPKGSSYYFSSEFSFSSFAKDREVSGLSRTPPWLGSLISRPSGLFQSELSSENSRQINCVFFLFLCCLSQLKANFFFFSSLLLFFPPPPLPALKAQEKYFTPFFLFRDLSLCCPV